MISHFSVLRRAYVRRKVYKELRPHFDPTFYKKVYPELKDCRDPLAHYIGAGWAEAKDPTIWFSTFGYLEANPDVRKSGINPFYHYIKHGRLEQRNPFPNGLAREVSSDAALSKIGCVRAAPPDFIAETLERDGISKALAVFDEARDALTAAGIYSPVLVRRFCLTEYRLLVENVLERPVDYLVHFACEGHRQLLPIAFDLELDHEFYKSFVAGIRDLSPSDTYIHWLSKGLPLGCPPNPRQFLRTLRLEGYTFPSEFDAELYWDNNDDLCDISHSRWLLLEHFVRIGALEGRRGCPLTPETASLYVAAADCLSEQEKNCDAQRLYEIVLASVPRQRDALAGLGDCLRRQGQFAAAAEIYASAHCEGRSSYSSYSNLIHCLTENSSFDAALEVSDTAVNLFPADFPLHRRRLEIVKTRFYHRMTYAHSYARGLRRDQAAFHATKAEDDLIEALSDSNSAATHHFRGPIRKVGIFGDYGLNQCRLYRIDQKIEQLKFAGFAVSAFRSPEDLVALADRMHTFDAIIFYRVPAVPEILELMIRARELGITTFYEIDDLIFDPARYPGQIESYAGLITREEYAGLLASPACFRAAARSCDYGIASTVPLARQLEVLVRLGRAFVHRNCLGRAHLRALGNWKRPLGKGETVIFFGSGTKAHTRDLSESAGPALARLFEAHPASFRLVLKGYQQMPAVLAAFKDRIDLLPMSLDFHDYLKSLAMADINISVLRRDVVSDCKSEIKWLEAALFGIPSVLSRTSNYEDTVEHGVTGFLAETEDEWFDALDRLVRHENLRTSIGDSARKRVLSNYSQLAAAKNLCSIFSAVAPPEQALGKKKKILIVNIHYPPFAIGGATRVVYDNVRDLLAQDDRFEIEVFTGLDCDRKPYLLETYSHEGVRVTTVSLPPFRGLTGSEDPEMRKVFSRYLEDTRPDLVHFHCIQRLTAALPKAVRAAGVPYVVTVHDAWWISHNQFLIDSLGRMEPYSKDDRTNMEVYGRAGAERARELRECLAAAASVVAVSESFATIYREVGFSNVVAIPNGLSLTPTAKRLVSKDCRRVRLGFLGGTEPHKGLALIRAALRNSAYKNLTLIIVDHLRGRGDETHDLWGETPVAYIGRVPPNEASSLYAGLDVLLAPSIWPESYGLVTREAVDHGLWVVASKKGSIGDCVNQGENGFLIETETPKGLAQVLSLIDADPSRYLRPPVCRPRLRGSADQAQELAILYASLTQGKSEKLDKAVG